MVDKLWISLKSGRREEEQARIVKEQWNGDSGRDRDSVGGDPDHKNSPRGKQ